MDQDLKFAEFVRLLAGLFKTFSKPLPSEDVIDIWFGLMGQHELPQLRNAFGRHIATAKDGFPKPSDVLKFLKKDPSDWPTAAVALGEMMLVESGSFAFVTNEHIGAYEAARLLKLNSFQGGKAFEAKYEALVVAGQAVGRKAEWFMSQPGGDPSGVYRREAVAAAVRLGRITQESGTKMIDGYSLPHLLLPGPTDTTTAATPDPKFREEIEKCRTALQPKHDEQPIQDMAPDVAVTRDAAAESQRRVDEYLAFQARDRAIAEREAAVAAREGEIAAHNPWAELLAIANKSAINFEDIQARVAAFTGGEASAGVSIKSSA